MGQVRLRITDAPADVQAVTLVVNEVAIHRADVDSSAWEVLDHDSTTVDLLTLRNGVFQTLGLATVPAGHYTQVRLKLSPGSSVMVGGVTYPLTVPSGLQSGYKLVGEFDVPAGGLIDLALDFDAARSVFETGAGQWMLKPTARVLVVPSTGSITGHVLPEDASTTVRALAGADTVQTTTTGTDGRFVLSLLPGGTYAVGFHPASGYRDTTIAGVVVTNGGATDLGDVQLTPQ
jgi:hypothetical protein